MTSKEISDICDITQKTAILKISGKSKFTLEEVIRLSEATDIKAVEIIEKITQLKGEN